MRQIILILTMALSLLTFSSCKENNIPLVWNLTAQAKGEGTVNVAFPTGNLTAEGAAVVTVKTSNETVKTDAPEVENVLAVPGQYDEDVYAFAQEVDSVYNSVFNVDAQGTWEIDIDGEAIQPDTGIRIRIKKHWPEQPVEEEVVTE